MYAPAPPPGDIKSLAGYVRSELERIAQELRTTTVTLEELHVEPAKPRNGMVILADGTDFDPGAGAGFYGRSAGAWVKLG